MVALNGGSVQEKREEAEGKGQLRYEVKPGGLESMDRAVKGVDRL